MGKNGHRIELGNIIRFGRMKLYVNQIGKTRAKVFEGTCQQFLKHPNEHEETEKREETKKESQ